MKNYRYCKEIPLNDTYDVIVVGGGPAGCTAAAACAREGRKTLLIETTGALGGMGTVGLVPSWSPFTDREKIIYKGMAEYVFTALKSQMPNVDPDATEWVAIDPEKLKRVYDELVTSNGADVLFHTVLSDAVVESGRVTEIVVSNKKGLIAYRAKVFIDCTGNADLAVHSGSAYVQGDEEGVTMPASLCFSVTGVNDYAYQFDPRSGWQYGGLHPHNKNSIIYDIAKDKRYPLVKDSHLCDKTVGPGTIGFNAGHLWDIDDADPEGISRAMIEGRQIAFQLHEALKEYFPSAFAASHLVSTAQLMGVREGRRIVGDYMLSIEDYLGRRTFEDEISRNCYYIDIHLSKSEAERQLANVGDLNLSKSEPEQELAHKNESNEVSLNYKKGESHGIPYRCMLPAGITNVIVAGKAVSCDRRLQASIRVMPNCLCMGEAAGIAAAIAWHSDDGNVHEINVQHLRQRLKEEGAYIL